MSIRKMNRTALLLALMIVFQSLRLYLPIPSFVSVYIIGSMVNACLLLAASMVGWKAAFVLAVTAPVVAYLQQVLPLPVLILPVAAANLAYVTGYLVLAGQNKVLAISMATATKFMIVYLTVIGLIQYIGITGNMAAMLTMMLGWPQWITGFGGGAIFFAVHKKLYNSTLG
ncbi:hypothetical protein SPFL3102_03892 [Sporomusaceae bacterium FL31]|nr:hypothetical protein SPFL3101_03888 [Sporomusaceae bacterium FL31]GCE36023.1 hypothetical protein SPFL3102_03892 [Sporomusaceae bacterium]